MIIRTKEHSFYADTMFRNDENPSLLMLHGFMGCGAGFSHLGDRLRTFSSPILLDLLGHGESDKPTDPEQYTSQKQVQQLHDIITAIGSEKPVLHGYSMGGRLALQFAHQHPDKISALILESTTPGLKTRKEQTDRIQTDEENAQRIEQDFENFISQWNQNPLFGDVQNPDREIAEAFQEGQQPEAMAASLRGFGTGNMPSLWNMLENTTIPVLLIAGADDHKFSMIMMEMDTMFPKSRLQIIPNAAHRVHIDQPDAYIETIQEFIQELPI